MNESETIASSACPVCGLDIPHVHTRRSIAQESRTKILREGFERALNGWWPRLKEFPGSYGKAPILTHKIQKSRGGGNVDEYLWGPVQFLWEVYSRVAIYEIPALPDDGVPDINEALAIQRNPWGPFPQHHRKERA